MSSTPRDDYNEDDMTKEYKRGMNDGLIRARVMIEKEACRLWIQREDSRAQMVRSLAGEIDALTS